MGSKISKKDQVKNPTTSTTLSKQESKSKVLVEKILVSGLKLSGKTFLIEKILDYLTIPNFSDFKQFKLKEGKKLDFVEMDKESLLKGRNLIGIKGFIFVINRKEYLSLHYSLEILLNIMKQNCRFHHDNLNNNILEKAFLHSIPILIVAINFNVTPLIDSYQSKTIFEEEFQAAYNQLFSILSRNFKSQCQYFEMEASESMDDTSQQSLTIEQILQKLYFTSANERKSTFEEKVKAARHEKDFQHYVQTMSHKNQVPHPVSPSSIFV